MRQLTQAMYRLWLTSPRVFNSGLTTEGVWALQAVTSDIYIANHNLQHIATFELVISVV